MNLEQGPEGELNAHAASIEDLDVSGNLLANWEEAERLCQELPRLHTLNLSCNLMQFARNRQKGQYSGMRQLVLNGCGLTFSQVEFLLRRACVPPAPEVIAQIHPEDS